MVTSPFPATITGVALGGAASRGGLLPGDRLLAINGQTVRDVIDVRILSAEPSVEFRFERDGKCRTIEVERQYGEPLGLAFARDLFDTLPRVCRNRCEFCFVTQMAPGMRGSLYVKDDDYRLSFLHGNYITLTNLEDADWDRIEAQYLSPLYISVHATDPDVRVDLMRNPRAGDILEHLYRLVELGIELHTQAVLVPGRNDGQALERTIGDLAELYPHVRDLTVVPVGLTRWHDPDLRVHTAEEAGAVMLHVLEAGERIRADTGVGFVYLSDEWYLRAGVQPPETWSYDGRLPELIENGVGMVRTFWEGRAGLHYALAPLGNRQTWVTGTLFAPQLTEYARQFQETTGAVADVVPVENRFFGETVTVAGLLTVSDILNTLMKRDVGDAIVIPEAVFRGPEGVSLDDETPQAIAAATERPVYLVDQAVSGAWTVTPAAG